MWTLPPSPPGLHPQKAGLQILPTTHPVPSDFQSSTDLLDPHMETITMITLETILTMKLKMLVMMILKMIMMMIVLKMIVMVVILA
jgi:hypothetical protein